jgi:hypothetical protein
VIGSAQASVSRQTDVAAFACGEATCQMQHWSAPFQDVVTDADQSCVRHENRAFSRKTAKPRLPEQAFVRNVAE